MNILHALRAGAACTVLTCSALLMGSACAQPAPPAPPAPPGAPPMAPPVAPAAPVAPATPVAPAAPAAPIAGEGRAYQPGPFDSIEISGSAMVRFTQGAIDQIFIEGDEDTQKAVQLELRDRLLQIRPNGAWKFWNNKRVQIHFTARDLRRVAISGAADWQALQPLQLNSLSVHISGAGLVRMDQLKADALSFQVSGAGDGQVAGSVNQLNIQVTGRSDFRGENLMSQRAAVKVSGIADVKVWVVQDLAVTVSGVGTVEYWGSPNVQRHASGIARINDRGAKRAQP